MRSSSANRKRKRSERGRRKLRPKLKQSAFREKQTRLEKRERKSCKSKLGAERWSC